MTYDDKIARTHARYLVFGNSTCAVLLLKDNVALSITLNNAFRGSFTGVLKRRASIKSALRTSIEGNGSIQDGDGNIEHMSTMHIAMGSSTFERVRDMLVSPTLTQKGF